MASVVTNSLAMLAARLSVPAFSFAINVGIARLLGEHVLGAYVELVALALIAQALAGGGFSPLVARDVAASPLRGDEVLRECHRIGLATGLAATGLFWLYARLVMPAEMQTAALWLALSILPSAWISVQEGWLVARELHPRIATISFVEAAVKVAAAAAVLALDGGLAGLCAGITAGRLVAFAMGLRVLASSGARGSWSAPEHALGPMLRALAPFAGMYAIGIVYFRQDVLVVGALRTERETGFYGVASAFCAIALLVPSSVMSALYPRLAAAFAGSLERWRVATARATRILIAGSVPLALGLIAVAEPVIRTIYGVRYVEAAPTLRLLAALLPLHGANAALGQAMQAAHLQSVLFGMTVFAVVTNLIANLVLVGRFGIDGAAWSLAISSGLSLLVQLWILHRRIAPLRPRPVHALALALVVAPVAASVVCEGWHRFAVAIGGTLLLGLLARPVGLLAADDLKRALARGEETAA